MPTLLTLGVDSYKGFTSARPFDLGGIGIMKSVRPFDVISPFLSTRSNRPFDVFGPVGVTSDRPFDLGDGGLLVTSYRPFDVIESGQVIDPGVVTPPTVNPTNAVQRIVAYGTIVGGTYTLTFDGYTTTPLEHDASAATIEAALVALVNVNSGDIVVTGGPLGHNVAVNLTFGGQYAGKSVATVSVQTSFVSTLVVPVAGIRERFVFSITANAKTVAAKTDVIVGTSETELDIVVPDGTMVLPIAVDVSTMVASWIVSSRQVTMTVNDDGSPDLTVVLAPRVPFFWHGSGYPTNPYTVDIVSLTFTNTSGLDAFITGAFLMEE